MLKGEWQERHQQPSTNVNIAPSNRVTTLNCSEESSFGQLLRKLESLKASIRSKVEHPFHIVKNLFHYKKVRYKGLEKNTAQLHTLFALANLMIAKRKLLALNSQVAS